MNILHIIGYTFVIFIFFILLKNLLKMKEGMTSGSAGTASNFNDEIKAKLTIIQDELLIPKYRTDYEDILINMEEYINLIVLKKIVNLNPENSADVSSINELNLLKSTLNSSIKFIDSQ